LRWIKRPAPDPPPRAAGSCWHSRPTRRDHDDAMLTQSASEKDERFLSTLGGH